VKNSAAEIAKLVWKRVCDPFYAGGAAEVSFWFLLSVVPSSVLLAQLLHLFTLSYEAIHDVLSSYLADEALATLMPLLEYRPSRTVTVLLVLLALWAGSRAIFSLMRISNYAMIGGLPYKSAITGWLRERARAILLTVVVLVTFIVALYILVFGELIARTSLSYANEYLGGGYTFSEVWFFWRWPIAFALFLLLTFCLYYLLPLTGGGYAALVTDSKIETVKRVTLEWFRGRRRALRRTLPGAVFAAAAMLIVTWVYAFYIRMIALPSYNLLYGGFSSVAVLLIWFFVMSYLLITGIQFNAAVAEWKEGAGETEPVVE
jgi:membrane protein